MLERLLVAGGLVLLGAYIMSVSGGLIDLAGLAILVCGVIVGVLAAVAAVKGNTRL